MKKVIIFGYNEYAKKIASNFKAVHEDDIRIYVINESDKNEAIADGYKSELVELDDEWLDIGQRYEISNLICFCALDDDAENVFLTISLRAEYENMHIVAIATSKDSADKLRLAGANKAIAKLETTANVIVESLEEPAIVEVMNEILSHNKELRLAEYSISSISVLKDKFLHDIDVHKEYNIIILAVSDKKMEADFTFTAEGYNHCIKEGDVLVVIGKENDLQRFEKVIE